MCALVGCATLPATTDPVARVRVLEDQYRAATANLDERLGFIYQIAALPGPVAVPALTRLFVAETELELKAELVSALYDPEGDSDGKLTLLTVAVLPDQPVAVRRTAIETMVALGDTRAAGLLQGLLSDSDRGIQEAAANALAQLIGVMRQDKR